MALWKIDPDHSVAAFVIRHMMICNVRGQFNKISGSLTFDQEKLEHSSVEAQIETSSIYTGISKRDEHLRSADFFDAEKYPQITFKSTKVQSLGESRFKLEGNLSMHGVTRPVTIEGEFGGPVKSPFGGETTIGFCATAILRRDEFGITWNEAMEAGGVIVGNEVKISLDIEADLAEE